MKIKIIVNGAFGKMGALACTHIQAHPEFEFVASLGRNDNLAQAIKHTKAQIVVELTRADCVYANSLTIVHNNVHPIIGASGLTDQQIQELTLLCQAQQLGGMVIPNFSIGAALMNKCAQLIAKKLNNVEIIETHHPQKIDAPSSTSIKTAKLIAESRQGHNINTSINAARGAVYYDIPIHSLRLPGTIANQQVIFGSVGETLTIAHDTLDRQAFMPGLIIACQQVQKIKTLEYGLENFLI